MDDKDFVAVDALEAPVTETAGEPVADTSTEETLDSSAPVQEEETVTPDPSTKEEELEEPSTGNPEEDEKEEPGESEEKVDIMSAYWDSFSPEAKAMDSLKFATDESVLYKEGFPIGQTQYVNSVSKDELWKPQDEEKPEEDGDTIDSSKPE